MENKNYYKLTFALLLIFYTSSSFAFGIGVTAGRGSETWEDNSVVNYANEGNREISNFGVVMDTTVARNRLFNYRFSLVKEDNDADPSAFDRINASGITMVHDFGFAAFRNRYVRLWLGPELRAAFYGDITPSKSIPGTDTSGGAVGFGLGAVVGVNVHMPKLVTFSFTAGYHLLSAYVGEYDLTSSTFFESTQDVDVDSNGTYFNASIIFRLGNDNY